MVIKWVKTYWGYWCCWNDFPKRIQASLNVRRTPGKRNRQTINQSVFDLWSLRMIYSKTAIDNCHHNLTLLEYIICRKLLATQCFIIHFITFVEFSLHPTTFFSTMALHIATISAICSALSQFRIASQVSFILREKCWIGENNFNVYTSLWKYLFKDIVYLPLNNRYFDLCGLTWGTLVPSNKISNSWNHQVRSYCTMKRLPFHISQSVFSIESSHCCQSEGVCIAHVNIRLCVRWYMKTPVLGLQPFIYM